MSYTIEVYRGNQKAEKKFTVYSLYVMFYPQLVAGPIERPQNILPQLNSFQPYNWENIKQGLLLMAWGLFKKVAIADRLAVFVDYAYNNPAEKNGLTLLMAAFFYSFQIYCDFSGYSDIAIGAARTMGFNLMENFKKPYFSSSITEFWQKWHISLSTWFRDYLYIPLGGNRKGIVNQALAIMIVFTISGLWHGAKWTFVIWGILHGIFIVINIFLKKYIPLSFSSNQFFKILSLFFTFGLVMFTWVFFRANNVNTAFLVLSQITKINLSDNIPNAWNINELLLSFILITLLLLKDRLYPTISIKNNFLFIVVFAIILIISYLLSVFNELQFIYFQF